VRFFKHLVNSEVKSFKTLQQEIKIKANTALEAEVIAERQFERLREIADWHFHADSVETEVSNARGTSSGMRTARLATSSL
jgi:hypothetical protein